MRVYSSSQWKLRLCFQTMSPVKTGHKWSSYLNMGQKHISPCDCNLLKCLDQSTSPVNFLENLSISLVMASSFAFRSHDPFLFNNGQIIHNFLSGEFMWRFHSTGPPDYHTTFKEIDHNCNRLSLELHFMVGWPFHLVIGCVGFAGWSADIMMTFSMWVRGKLNCLHSTRSTTIVANFLPS